MRSEIDVKEVLLLPESLISERKLSPVYETLYFVFLYIGQNYVQSLLVRFIRDSGYSIARCALRTDGVHASRISNLSLQIKGPIRIKRVKL